MLEKESDKKTTYGKPEEQARQKIDQMLKEAGWKVVCREDFLAHEPCAVCEQILEGAHRADYMLFLDGKAIAVIEAKRAEVNLDDPSARAEVAQQAEGYTTELPEWAKTWSNPIPLVYLSNGESTYFKSLTTSDDYQKTNSILTPKKMRDYVPTAAEISRYAALPELKPDSLRTCQYEAIRNFETSLRDGKTRALVVMATGAGKTFTACLAAYRLLEYAKNFKHVLFLVDRTALGTQANGEFGRFRLTSTREAFTSIFTTDILNSKTIGQELNLTISTIQRLYAAMTGKPLPDENTDEDDNTDDNGNDNPPQPPPDIKFLGQDGHEVHLPRDYFDLIIVDECHRSIYSNWGNILTYFEKAILLGLTATPGPETLDFFENNVVLNYTLEQSILDGVNVSVEPYNILTLASTDGGTVLKNTPVIERINKTGEKQTVTTKDNIVYTPCDLDRAIENDSQIELILKTYREKVYTDLYPERSADFASLPKTLIFAKSERHAQRIVQIAREKVFHDQCENNPSFVQTITYSSPDPQKRITEFRNSKEFRIAVTVTLVATGTDIKPLEVLLFMRRVGDLQLFQQMRGRAVRTLSDDVLRAVTPNADRKSHAYLIDAVGLQPEPKDRDKTTAKPPITFKEMFEQMLHGVLPDEYLSRFAGRMAYANNIKRTPKNHLDEFATLAGNTLRFFAQNIYDALKNNTLPDYIEKAPNPEREALIAFVADNLQTRKKLLEIFAGYRYLLDPGEDTLITVGFDTKDAQNRAAKFEQCIRENEDHIQAIHLIATSAPITYADLTTLRDWLTKQDPHFNMLMMWSVYRTLDESHTCVIPLEGEAERIAVTNLIPLVRYALHKVPRLASIFRGKNSRFNLWCGQKQRGTFTPEMRNILSKICDYILTNGTINAKTLHLQERARAVQAFHNLENLNAELAAFSAFMLKSDESNDESAAL